MDGSSDGPTGDGAPRRGSPSAEAAAWAGRAFHDAPIAAAVVDVDGRIAVANAAFHRLLGHDAALLGGRWLLSFIYEEDRIDADRSLASLRSGEKARIEVERRYLHASGAVLLAHESMAVSHDGDGRRVAFVVQLQDVGGRREAAAVLQAREARLRLLLEQIPALVWTTDEQLRITSARGRRLESLGVTPDEAVDVSLAEYLGTDDPQFPPLAAHRRALAGESVTFEAAWRGRVFRTHVEPLREGAQGAVVGTIGVASDVTELKQAEDAMRSSEQKFRSLMEAMATATFIFQGPALVYANPAAARITGYPVDELERMAFWEIIHPLDRQTVRDRGIARQEGRTVPSRYEVRIRTKQGEERWMDYSGLVIEYAGSPAVLGTAMDITDRKHAEAALRESEGRFRAVFEKSPIGMALVDVAGVLVDVNDSLCRMVGHRPEELRGRSISDAPRAAALAPTLADMRRMAEVDGPLVQGERRLTREDGEVGWFRLTASAIRGVQGTLLYSLVMVEDVSDQHRTEQRAQEHRAQLGRIQRLHSLGELAAGLAHELNQPLAAVVSFAKGCIHRARRGDLGSDELVTKLEQIADEALRAGSIIKVVQRFLRNQRPRRAPVALGSVLANIARLVDSEARRRGVSLVIEAPAELPGVMAESVEIEQVLFNLVRNALEAIEAASEGEARIEIAARQVEGCVELAVRDTGPGIGPGDPERIFEPFYSSKEHGMGLGLSISRSIIQAHGGRLWVSESGGTGTTFRFTLPIEAGGREA